MLATDRGQHDVVICYNNVDVEQVRRLHLALGVFGLDCWVDFHHPLATYWRDGVKDAYDDSGGAIVVLGPTGPGESQIDEIMYFIETSKKEGKHLLFLLLPEAKKLDKIGSRGKPHISALEHADEPAVIEKILQILKPSALTFASGLGFFRILKPRPRTCFLALPRISEPALLAPFSEVARSLGCSIMQDIDGRESDFEADVLSGVANSSIVLADGRCLATTNHIDPSVAHVLGIARAYGKPIIIVMDRAHKPEFPTFTAKRLIEFDADSDDALSQLKVQLRLSITDALKLLKFHGMLSPHAIDMHVIAHSALRLSAAQWKYFAQAVSTCKLLADKFSAIGHHLSGLRAIAHQAEIAEDDRERRREMPRWWNEFCKSLNEDYKTHHVERVVPLLAMWAERQDALNSTLGRLAKSEPNEAGKAFGNARDFLELMGEGIERFNRVHEILLSQNAKDKGVWSLGPDWYHGELLRMRDYANEVMSHALASITSFLPLFGYEAEQFQGTVPYANDQTSIAAAN